MRSYHMLLCLCSYEVLYVVIASYQLPMAVQKFLWLALLLLALTSIFQSFCSSQSLIFVDSECDVANESCYGLDDALDDLTSNTTLELESGTHVIRRSHVQGLRNMSDVSIVGDGREETVVSCADEFALSFINVTNLMISNLTITGCGLTGNSLQDAASLLLNIIDLNFYIPPRMEVGIFLGYCQNFRMTNALIRNTSGIGLLGVNVFGNSELEHVNFTHNIHPGCQFSVFEQGNSSGGAYFLYEDLHNGFNDLNDNITLSISNCNFSYNADCSDAGLRNLVYQYPSINVSYYTGGGGGLSLVTTQQNYTVNVEVKSSDFYKNDAYYGGGAYIALFAGLGVNSVQFVNCTFYSNGLSSGTSGVDKSQNKGGAGIVLFMDMLLFTRGSKIGRPPSVGCVECKSIKIVASNFTSNAAIIEGGAVMVYSLSKSIPVNYDVLDPIFELYVYFSKCHFENNFAMYGSALYIFQSVTVGFDGVLLILFNDIFITGSRTKHTSDNTLSNPDKVSAIDLRNVITRIGRGNLTIKENEVSGIHLSSSSILMEPHAVLTIKKNRANHGAGIYMDGSVPMIHLHKSSKLLFSENQANLEGGGVYYQQSIEENILRPLGKNISDCFLFSSHESSHFFELNLTIEFYRNVAPKGSMVFGTSLGTCPWARQLNVTHDYMIYMELYNNSEYYNSTFIFSKKPNGTKQISSDPFKIKVDEQNKSIEAYPGQLQHIKVRTFDLFMNKIGTVITTNRIGSDDFDIKIGISGFWYCNNSDMQLVSLYINGNTNGGNRTVSLLTLDNKRSTDITVRILDCPLGFVYNNHTQSCKCNNIIIGINDVDCSETSMAVIINGRKWLGCAYDNCSVLVFEELVLPICYFSYCNPGSNSIVIINQSSFDEQCANGLNRAGVMCGRCAEGYSSVFGSDICKVCNDTKLTIAFIFIILIIGSVHFLCIALLGLTVDKGWTNIVVLLASIVFPYAFVEATPFKVILSAVIPLKAFTLDFNHVGFDGMCFYDGMTPIVKYVLYFVNPLYLLILMIIFTIFCHFSTRLSTFFSPSKTLVSLAIILYVIIFKSSLEILVGLPMKTIGGKDLSPRWLIDPNVQYFDGLHGVFVIVSILLFIGYIIPLPLALLSPTLAYKYVPRSKPLLDVIWAPFKPKYRFWISVRLLVSIFIAASTKFIISSTSVLLNASVLFILAYLQIYLQPFDKELINIADSFLIFATGFLHASLYNRAIGFQNADHLKPTETACIVIILSSIYFVLFLTLILCSKNKTRELFKKFHAFLKAKRTPTELSEAIQNSITHTSVKIIHPNRNYTKLRESLLEEEGDRNGIQ